MLSIKLKVNLCFWDWKGVYCRYEHFVALTPNHNQNSEHGKMPTKTSEFISEQGIHDVKWLSQHKQNLK